jgi:hypothetical protein
MSSDQCLDYFNLNTPYQFKSHLRNPLILNGLWKVALVEADITTNYSREDSLYLHSNVCEESIVDGLEKPLLRRLISTSMGNWITIFDSPHYHPVRTNIVYNIEICITTEKDQLASFLNNTSTVTLHFKSFPCF